MQLHVHILANTIYASFSQGKYNCNAMQFKFKYSIVLTNSLSHTCTYTYDIMNYNKLSQI